MKAALVTRMEKPGSAPGSGKTGPGDGARARRSENRAHGDAVAARGTEPDCGRARRLSCSGGKRSGTVEKRHPEFETLTVEML